ncbi:uncharacterized protein EI90DRAFT_3029762 [Cantharellus anzutake]|uniref:uncharacterized protein n=1 Tax=Cantharellus anzutake TaxID=1750568 RepID=UPI0019041ECB|nr:uncharacterized protein EI90DRAFT_3029762 [Cantharellus anzutake]KAF8342654.1 hypothetical protein EI90DRAFT_3029762 [Cantharellus anzutake]
MSVRPRSFLTGASLMQWHATVWFCGSFVCDVFVTLPVAWTLDKQRGRGFKQTDLLFNQVVIWIINTGILTAAFALLVIIFSLTNTHSLVYVSLNLVLASIYSNSLLAFLNQRGK